MSFEILIELRTKPKIKIVVNIRMTNKMEPACSTFQDVRQEDEEFEGRGFGAAVENDRAPMVTHSSP